MTFRTTVVEAGFHRITVNRHRETQAAPELADTPLADQYALVFVIAFGCGLGADCQQIIVNVDADIIKADTGQIGADDVALFVFLDIDSEAKAAVAKFVCRAKQRAMVAKDVVDQTKIGVTGSD